VSSRDARIHISIDIAGHLFTYRAFVLLLCKQRIGSSWLSLHISWHKLYTPTCTHSLFGSLVTWRLWQQQRRCCAAAAATHAVQLVALSCAAVFGRVLMAQQMMRHSSLHVCLLAPVVGQLTLSSWCCTDSPCVLLQLWRLFVCSSTALFGVVFAVCSGQVILATTHVRFLLFLWLCFCAAASACLCGGLFDGLFRLGWGAAVVSCLRLMILFWLRAFGACSRLAALACYAGSIAFRLCAFGASGLPP
jgi:hypothetical protein